MALRNTYRELEAWQYAMDLVETVYRLTRSFPSEERYCLAGQLRRASVSIPSNIAEGQGRGSRKEFCQFLWVARGSLCELETQLLIAGRLGYLDRSATEEALKISGTVGRLLNGLSRSLVQS